MNERIKELRMKVDMDMRLHNLEDIKAMEGCFGQEGGNKIVNDYIEKFAELIVKECAQEAYDCAKQFRNDEHYRADNLWPHFESVCNAVGDDIKIKFGVEK
jgi:hypothetical protein